MAEMDIHRQEKITEQGNPSKPRGEAGMEMLARMNESHARVTEWALSHFDWQGDEQVLDIGCGGGAALQRMAAHITSGKLTGVDYSQVSVEASILYNKEAVNSGRMQVCRGSVEALPFRDNSFDKITTVESFYFWPDPQENLREVYRVLQKGGTFLLIADIYNHPGLSEKTRKNVDKYAMFNPTREEYRQLLENAGFTGVVIHTKDGEDWICAEGHK